MKEARSYLSWTELPVSCQQGFLPGKAGGQGKTDLALGRFDGLAHKALIHQFAGHARGIEIAQKQVFTRTFAEQAGRGQRNAFAKTEPARLARDQLADR